MRRKQKMAMRGTAEREGRNRLLHEAARTYLLVYRARGYVGPYPLPTLHSPGLLGYAILPVVSP